VIGDSQLAATSLRTLGLTQGKGLFRFFYKKPEVLKEQANVYDMKVPVKVTPEPEPAPVETEAVPMETEPTPTAIVPENTTPITPEERPSSPETGGLKLSPHMKNKKPVTDLKWIKENLRKPTSKTAPMQTNEQADSSPITTSTEDTNIDNNEPKDEPVARPSSEDHTPMEPDSTDTPVEPLVINIGDNDALVFSCEGQSASFGDVGDDFFNLTLDDVKVLHKDLRESARDSAEGEVMMTSAMREAQKEGEKLGLLNRYKHCVLRVQFPDRHVLQAVYSPGTTIHQVLSSLTPHLADPTAPGELYTAPPRTTLAPSSSLLDLCLLPAALVHFASPSPHLSNRVLEDLSNLAGANLVASRYRTGRKTQGGGSAQDSRRRHEGEEKKVPKWFKTGK